jgi:type I restriction enzyme S subunit
MSRWPKIILGDVMAVNIDAVPSITLDNVNLAGVYGFGRGLFKRGPISPIDTTYKVFHRLHAGDFVISTPKAWEGAVARIADEFEGWFLSPVFPTFSADSKRLDTRYLDWYCKRESVWNELSFKAKGIGARRESVTASQFLSLEIPLPSLDEQRVIVDRLDSVAEKARQVEAQLNEIEAYAERLLAIRFRETIENAEWRPMAEVAPLVRREVQINAEDSYTELGIRSFYKGAFHRRTLSGAEYTWQSLYWVKTGDLIFSNIMAWEQAIAIAKVQDYNCVGNHRMLTCAPVRGTAIPGFLWYYFTTADGFAKILAASPGTAARNKTLKGDALMAIQVPIPNIAKQQAFDKLQCAVTEIKAKHSEIRKELNAMQPSMLEQVFQKTPTKNKLSSIPYQKT